MAAATAHYNSVFGLGDVRRSKSIGKPNFVRITIHGWDITTSSLEKLTSVILQFHFLFWLWPISS